jgi:sulfur-oxidizing protein SoxA
MKNFILVLLFAFSLPAIAEPVVTAGYEEKTPEATLKAIEAFFHQTMPNVKGDAFVEGALNFPNSDLGYNKMWAERLSDGAFDQPEEYAKSLAIGKKIWETPFANGKTFASCFANGGKGAANDYPKVDAASGKVVTFEAALNKCLTDNNEKPLAYDDANTMGNLSVHARRLSNGMRIKMSIKTPAELAAFNRGKEVFYGRTGKADQSCANCHIQHAGQVARTEDLSPIIGQAAHFPVYRPNPATGDLALITLQTRYAGCQKSTGVEKPIKQGSDASNDMEYFHTYISNGLPLSAGVFRK